MGRSVNRRVSYAADLIASNEELEFPHTKSFIAGLVFLFSAIFSFKLTGRIKMSDFDYYYFFSLCFHRGTHEFSQKIFNQSNESNWFNVINVMNKTAELHEPYNL